MREAMQEKVAMSFELKYFDLEKRFPSDDFFS